MTTATLAAGNRTMGTGERPRRSLEELVDRLFETLFAVNTETAELSATRTIHEARRLGQTGDIDGALLVLAGMDTARATPRKAPWAFLEWNQMVKPRFGDRDTVVYSRGAGRAAVLVPRGDDGVLEVVSALGMRWRPGTVVSCRSLRGLRPLGRACP